ncbi:MULTISPECIES: hypothetical protein [Bacillus]|uniref:Uncharacterized protein n=1 Tax=Bacillus thuringiensis DB27 TaxID=1431339 RepID=W8YB49_BACTU|nr:hypothetical protein [Bacillus thuringiensis]MBG9629179.1 phage related protein [Bacillus thuringiensis]MBG9669241.1 phage related protein [Bacillus thuringiensis]MBH0355972.1 phage related protein [Bacillus thuringiensis]MED3271488.1 hypothetical protein [Bacillus thuringiensis]OTW55699.1 hypothetical protein BK703_15915 [Bacillus thuringiensis serovar silo]
MDNQNNEMKVGIVELRIQVVGLQQTIENLVKRVNMLEEKLAMKADINHVREIAEQSVIIKKINDSKSVGMDCKVGVSLDGMVVAESVVKQTTNGYKLSATNIKGVGTNETK